MVVEVVAVRHEALMYQPRRMKMLKLILIEPFRQPAERAQQRDAREQDSPPPRPGTRFPPIPHTSPFVELASISCLSIVDNRGIIGESERAGVVEWQTRVTQ